MQEYKVFVQRIGLIGLSNILIALSSLILLPILTKNLSINDYGIWVQINVTIALVSNIANLGLFYSMLRFLSVEKDKKRIQEGFYSIGIIVLLSSFCISAFLFLFSENIGNALLNSNIGVARLLSIIVFFACLNLLLLNFFRTFQEMKKYSAFLLIQNYLGVSIISYLAITGFGIFVLSLGLLFAYLITFLIMISLVISEIGFKYPSFKNLREYLFFGLPTIPSNLSYWIVDSSDRYVIGILLGTIFVGYYAPGYTLGNMIMMIVAPFSFLLPAILPKYYEENNIEQVILYLKYSLKYFLMFAIPSVFILSILSKPILMILTTSQIALNGYLITPFVALSALLYGIYAILSNVIILEKKTKILGIIWAVAAVLNLSLNIAFVQYFGILGAAAITLIAYIFALALTGFKVHKLFKFDFDFVFILKSLVASILISFIIILINPTDILSILITSLISIIIYFILLLFLKSFKKEEFILFRKFVN